jgi:hypothetical protein
MTLEDFREITKKEAWRSRAHLLLNEPKRRIEITEQFGTYWIEGGHHIREQIADDVILVRLLRHMLPPYEGSAVTLFRGESQERWGAGQFGLAWTTKIDVAKMFGIGPNSVPSGGVLLQGDFKPIAIIAGPNAHSRYLGEEQYTIDPFYVENIVAVEEFPPCS